ncbi:MAG: energy transducer TonB [Thermoanaerobaculia bacterium]|nr:energy transducer TonB [Thermoanaerobaculia bacterium]
MRHLEGGRWKKAEKAAAQAADEAARTLWARAEAASLLAELALYRAVAEINLGREREAIWHWQTSLGLWPAIAERPLEGWGEAARLAQHPLRRAGEMPPGISPVDDLDLLRLEPAELDYGDGPTVDNPTAARRGPHGEIRVEMVVDRDGMLGSPRVLSEAAHPVLVYAMLDWLGELPPAEPARLDGEPVDALLTVAIDFDASWSKGGLFLVPEDGR